MKHYLSLFIAVVICLLTITTIQADDEADFKTDLDAVANPRLLDTLFCRYGFEPLKTLRRKKEWVQIRLPGEVKGEKASQTGLYSYVALAGDFTFEVKYFWGAIPVPKGGYGMSCGIALETHGPAGMLALARNFSEGKGGSGYAVTQGKPVDGDMKYETEIFKSQAKTGRLAFKREGKVVICLAADGKKDLEELCRVDYTDGTIRQIRLYADPGGSSTPMNAWIGHLRVHAQEITGGFPKLERRGGFPWWWVIGGLLVVGGVVSVVLFRRYRKPE